MSNPTKERTMHQNTLWRGAAMPMAVCLAALLMGAALTAHADEDRIRPYEENPFYWQYQGEPVLLLGGSSNDNLFQHLTGLKAGGDENGHADSAWPAPMSQTLEEHLDTLVAVGGNYLRNTTSHRNEGNVFPYVRLENGKFDLDQWNPEFWRRFDNFLKLTFERDIIVQVEMLDGWDHGNFRRHDPYISREMMGWINSPYNPANNVNYTAEEAGLPTEWIDEDTRWNHGPFFHTVLNNNTMVMPYQQAWFEKVLEHCLEYPHVLYALMNESNIEPMAAQEAWSEHWIQHLHAKAEEAGTQIYITEMPHYVWPNHDEWGPFLREMADRPDLYTFIEVSNNNLQPRFTTAQEGYDYLMTLRQWLVEGTPRPMNNTKVYGRVTGEDWGPAPEKFWRNIMAGCASNRFHRDWIGLALFGPAMAHIRSARMFSDEINVFTMEPRNDLLSDREENEAYLLAEVGRQYALYFSGAGDGRVTVDLRGATGQWKLRWLNIRTSEWTEGPTLSGGRRVDIDRPDAGHWAAVILPTNISPERPNIIIINIDDMGGRDVGFMGSEYYETPNIDKLAREGVIFTQGYAAAANCAPSRASLMTGQWTPRHGILTVNPFGGESKYRRLIPIQTKTTLPDNKVTLADVLRNAGYVTCHAGKWHISDNPLKNGFDHNIGGSHAGHPRSYYPPYGNVDLEPPSDDYYLTNLIMDKSLDFVKSAGKQPFFLNYSPYAVHTPIHPYKQLLPKYKNKPPWNGQDNARYATMIENLDTQIGRLLSCLKEEGKLSRTFILFTSDNGGVYGITKQLPLRSGKGSYYEGGIRVPLFACWPGTIEGGRESNVPVSHLDFFPTILEVAGIERPDDIIFDGQSLLRLLTGKGSFADRPLFWHFPFYSGAFLKEGDPTQDPLFRTRPGSAVRMGNWKLIQYFEYNDLELYNLKDDISEKNNLAEKNPEKSNEMLKILEDWREEVKAPVPVALNPEYTGMK